MRSLNRNKRLIYYANRTSEIPNIDEWGNQTGERTPVYSEARPMYCNVSPAIGEEAVQAFGSFTGYVRTMYVADNTCPIGENSVIWFGVKPPNDPHNYIVVRKADSKNGILYALQEVTVT